MNRSYLPSAAGFLAWLLLSWPLQASEALPPQTGEAAVELILIEQAGCHWCEAWDEDIGGIYAKTEEGKRAPLRRIDMHDDLPSDLKSMKNAFVTPTFVLWSDGKEVARLQGYPGPDFFWPLLNEMLDKMDK